ncbi:MAG: ABC transporter ATP-binding protein [Protaetiibacter sp.]
MAQTPPMIELDHVTIRYGQQTAVRDISLSVREGELVTLLGPSGSGKTTLLNVVAGAFAPDQGAVRIHGKDVSETPPHRRNAGMVFQSYTLFPSKTLWKNVAFPLQIRRMDRHVIEEKVRDALEQVHLLEHAQKLPSEISGGQAQRVALARAMVYSPEIMLFDEPLGALDRALRKELQTEIRQMQQRLQVAALYVTHDQEEAMGISDRIALMRDGEIVQLGTPRDVYENPATVWAATFLGEANVWPVDAVLETEAGWTRIRTGEAVLEFIETGQRVGGEARQVVIRPEDCLLSVEPPGSVPSLPGTVAQLEYFGTIQRIRVELDAGLSVAVVASGREMEWRQGRRVHCSWRPGAHRIMET